MAMSGAWLSTTRTSRLAPLPCRGAHGLLCQVDTSAVDTCLRDLLVSTFQRTFDRIAQVDVQLVKSRVVDGLPIDCVFPPGGRTHSGLVFLTLTRTGSTVEPPSRQRSAHLAHRRSEVRESQRGGARGAALKGVVPLLTSCFVSLMNILFSPHIAGPTDDSVSPRTSDGGGASWEHDGA